MMIKAIFPNWSAPSNVRAFTTTRQGGVSAVPYNSLNLGSHVGDSLPDVINNRSKLVTAMQIPEEPIWLNQTHSTRVIDTICYQTTDADGSYSHQARAVSVVLTADCLPVLFCSKFGNEVAAAHAGWRGLCDGILENTVSRFNCSRSQIIAWLGPAIGPSKFEVGEEVKAQFMAHDSEAEQAFKLIPTSQQKYLANLYLLATQRLQKLGITLIYGGDFCTYSQSDLFYSYRRERETGRMASVIWFE
ncbi:peptidoglycan editing factor PgeF [Orbus mooreae]